jgi:hypothetical protein
MYIGCGKLRDFPILARRVIHFEDSQLRMRISARESVQSGAQYDVLPDPACKGSADRLFAESASCRKKCARGARDLALDSRFFAPQCLCMTASYDSQCKGIVKDLRDVPNLVRCAAQGSPHCSCAWTITLHTLGFEPELRARGHPS